MDELLDMIIADESPSNSAIRSKIYFLQSHAERVDAFRPMVANTMFNGEDEPEVEDDDDLIPLR